MNGTPPKNYKDSLFSVKRKADTISDKIIRNALLRALAHADDMSHEALLASPIHGTEETQKVQKVADALEEKVAIYIQGWNHIACPTWLAPYVKTAEEENREENPEYQLYLRLADKFKD